VNGYGEETGWRGFALPLLQRRFTPLTAMLLLAAIWAGWHLPMFLVVNSFRGFSAVTVVGWLLGLTAGSIVLGWLYNRSGGSVALVAVWHAGFNMVSATAAATGLIAAIVTTAVMVQQLFWSVPNCSPSAGAVRPSSTHGESANRSRSGREQFRSRFRHCLGHRPLCDNRAERPTTIPPGGATPC
jgi:hypothetical protein